jgi:hypothetical protein
MGWSTSLRPALDRLVQLAQSAESLVGVTVRDGPSLESDTDLRVLYIGWSGGDTDTDAETQVGAEGLDGNPDREASVIRCTAFVRNGDADIPTTRADAYDIVSGLGAALDTDRTLGGTVMRASIGSHTLTQQQTSRGANVAISFEVDLDAFTIR